MKKPTQKELESLLNELYEEGMQVLSGYLQLQLELRDFIVFINETTHESSPVRKSPFYIKHNAALQMLMKNFNKRSQSPDVTIN